MMRGVCENLLDNSMVTPAGNDRQFIPTRAERSFQAAETVAGAG